MVDRHLKKLRIAAQLLPVDSKVVLELITEIDFLREELHQRDKYVDEQIKRAGWFDLVNGRNQLMEVRDQSLRIHKALHQTGSE